jgi:hypothetical protein
MNKELERLIDLALVDGVISDKEKKIILKKSEKLDISLDEVELIIDAKIFEKSQDIDIKSQKDLKVMEPNLLTKKTKKKAAKINDPLISDDSILGGIIFFMKFVLRTIYSMIKGFFKFFEFLGCFSVIVIIISTAAFSLLFF